MILHSMEYCFSFIWIIKFIMLSFWHIENKLGQSLRNQTQTHVTLVSMVITFLNPLKNINNKFLKPLRTLKALIYPQTLINTNSQDPQKHYKLFDWLAVSWVCVWFLNDCPKLRFLANGSEASYAYLVYLMLSRSLNQPLLWCLCSLRV